MSAFDDKIIAIARDRERISYLERRYSSVFMEIATCKNRIKQLDGDLRLEALGYFYETGDPNPHDAISVKKVHKKHYNTADNLARAIENNPNALCVDPDAFKAVAGLVASALREFGDNPESDRKAGILLHNLMMEILAVDEKVAKDEAWAVPSIEETRVVFIKQKLGEYINSDQSETENSSLL